MDDTIDAICCSYGEDGSGRLVGLRLRDGALEETTALATPAPMFAAIGPDAEHCYVVHHEAGGEIRSFAIDPDGRDDDASDEPEPTLVETSSHSTGGEEPCYVSVDPAGEFVFSANYAAGSISLFPIRDDGSLGERTQLIEHEGSGPNEDRQRAAHPHSIVPGPNGRLVYVADLGTDDVWCYDLDRTAGRLEPAATARVPIHDGAGPRHLAFGRDGDRAYLANELDSTLTVLGVDGRTGALEPRQTVDTLPDDATDDGRAENYPADVHVHPGGAWVYVSNRGHDSIATFAVGEDGENGEDGDVIPAGHEPTQGEWPRDLALDPAGEHLFAENRRSDEIVGFGVDSEDGGLASTGDRLSIQEPICLAFLDDSS